MGQQCYAVGGADTNTAVVQVKHYWQVWCASPHSSRGGGTCMPDQCTKAMGGGHLDLMLCSCFVETY